MGPDIYVLIQLVPRIFYCTDEEVNNGCPHFSATQTKQVTIVSSTPMLLRFGVNDATGIDASVLILQDKIHVSLMLLVLVRKIYLTPSGMSPLAESAL